MSHSRASIACAQYTEDTACTLAVQPVPASKPLSKNKVARRLPVRAADRAMWQPLIASRVIANLPTSPCVSMIDVELLIHALAPDVTLAVHAQTDPKSGGSGPTNLLRRRRPGSLQSMLTAKNQEVAHPVCQRAAKQCPSILHPFEGLRCFD